MKTFIWDIHIYSNFDKKYDNNKIERKYFQKTNILRCYMIKLLFSGNENLF